MLSMLSVDGVTSDAITVVNILQNDAQWMDSINHHQTNTRSAFPCNIHIGQFRKIEIRSHRYYIHQCVEYDSDQLNIEMQIL